MAQKVQVLLVDDIDGGTADETVQFGLDGVSYEIDLSAGNARKLRDAVAGYVAEARRLGGRGPARRRAGGPARNRGGEAATVRKWARANGWKVSDRGRIPAPVQEAYRVAH